MNIQQTPARFSPNLTVDRQSLTHAIRSPETPANDAPTVPHADSSEPAELLPVAVRGYN